MEDLSLWEIFNNIVMIQVEGRACVCFVCVWGGAAHSKTLISLSSSNATAVSSSPLLLSSDSIQIDLEAIVTKRDAV